MKTWTNAILALGLIAGMTTNAALAESIDESRPAAADGRIQFTGVTGDFEIIGHDADEFLLSGELGDDVDELVIEGDAEYWKIRLEMKEGNNRRATASNLRLLVPRGTELDVEVVSADLVLGRLDGPSIDVRSVSGDIDLQGVTPRELIVRSVSGDVTADAAASEISRFETVSGDVEVDGAGGRIEMESVSGDIEIEGTGISEFSAETVSSDIVARLRTNDRARLAMTTHSGDLEFRLPSAAAPRIGAVTFSGSIESAFGGTVKSGTHPGERLVLESNSDLEVNAKTFSGNVTIEKLD